MHFATSAAVVKSICGASLERKRLRHVAWQEAGRYIVVGFIYSFSAQQHTIIFLACQVGNNMFDGI